VTAQADRTWHYINVDLEIMSRSKLDVLVAELGPKLHEMHVGASGGYHRANYEVALVHATPSVAIQRFVRLVERLGPKPRRAWDRAARRDFNVGIQAGLAPRSFELAIDEQAVRAVASVGGRIVVTVYAPMLPKPRARPRRKP
jgi:hypothetical protein